MRPLLLADDDADEAFLVVRAFRDAGVANPVVVVPDGEAVIRFSFAARASLRSASLVHGPARSSSSQFCMNRPSTS